MALTYEIVMHFNVNIIPIFFFRMTFIPNWELCNSSLRKRIQDNNRNYDLSISSWNIYRDTTI